MKNSVWIVIVTFNAEKWIEACLNSIVNSTVGLNAVIIDNASSDHTVQLVINNFPQFKLIQQLSNHGFGYSNNIGISYGLKQGAEYIALLNQDAKLHINTIELLISYSKKYPEYGILSPMLYSYDGNLLDNYMLKWIFCDNIEFASELFFKREKDVYDVNLMPGAMWLMRREALETAGGFDPVFFMYGEDDDLWRRMKLRGWKAGFFSKTFAYHNQISSNYTIKKRVWYASSAHLLQLKNEKDSFLICLGCVIFRYFRNTLFSLINFNKSEFFVHQLSFYSIIFRLNTIRKNRILSYYTKMPFLES
jgi:GT2 family glycosyltransferase